MIKNKEWEQINNIIEQTIKENLEEDLKAYFENPEGFQDYFNNKYIEDKGFDIPIVSNAIDCEHPRRKREYYNYRLYKCWKCLKIIEVIINY